MVEVKNQVGVGGKDRTAQRTPPYLTHTPSNARDRCHGAERDKGSRWEKGRLRISVILRMDSVSKTRQRQEKKKRRKTSECQRQQIVTCMVRLPVESVDGPAVASGSGWPPSYRKAPS